MADNISVTAGSGTSLASDEIGGVHFQRVKVTFGPDGTATDVSAIDPLPVTGDFSIAGPLAVTGTFYPATQPVSGTVSISGAVAVTGSFFQATQPVSIASMPSTPVTGTFWQATQPVSGTVTANAGSGTFAVSAASLPLPSGAATETTLAAVNTKTPSLGQAAMAASRPVVIASNQSALAVTGTFWQATQPVSGTVGVSGSVAVTGTFWQATQPVSGTVAATQSGTWNIGSITTLPTLANVTTVATVTNLSQLGGTAVAMNTGIRSAGTQRVTIATDDLVPVSGPLTDAQLRTTPVPVSGTFTPAATPESTATFRGRATTFRTPGRAGTAGQKLFALHNASGSTKIVHINAVTVDLFQTVIKAVTVAPPVIRIHRFTAIPTNGTALTKVSKDTGLSTNGSITAWGDASADGTGSGTTLTVTIPSNSCLSQEYAPRLITAAGYEMFDRTEMVVGYDIVLRALEGIVVNLDYTLATQNPTTDMWIVGCDWWEV